MTTYTSSIVTKYGDINKVRTDSKTLHEICQRQGTSLLIDIIAEHVGKTTIDFKLSEAESQRILASLVSELKESILERI